MEKVIMKDLAPMSSKIILFYRLVARVEKEYWKME
jgi:hypothetical protein